MAITVYYNVVHTDNFTGLQGISQTATTNEASGQGNAAAVGVTHAITSKYDGKEEIPMDPLLPSEQPEIRYPEPYYCYHKNSGDMENVDLLDDIVLSKRQPTPDKSIFFVISSCFENHRVEIRKR